METWNIVKETLIQQFCIQAKRLAERTAAKAAAVLAAQNSVEERPNFNETDEGQNNRNQLLPALDLNSRKNYKNSEKKQPTIFR